MVCFREGEGKRLAGFLKKDGVSLLPYLPDLAAGYVMGIATDKGQPLGPKSLFEITRTRVQPFLSLASFAKYVK